MNYNYLVRIPVCLDRRLRIKEQLASLGLPGKCVKWSVWWVFNQPVILDGQLYR